MKLLPLTAAVALLPALGWSQTTNWIAYNDHNPGAGTAANVTSFTPQAANTTVGGALIDFATGSPRSEGMEVTTLGDYNDFDGGSSAPNAGTPADQIWGGKVDWAASALYFGDTPGSVTVTFTNLNPGSTYSFRGTAVRGNNYATRWSVATISGANGFVPAHITATGSPGIVTNGWAPYGNNLMPNTQAAWNAGENRVGDVIGWDQIVPNGTSFSIVCSNWTEATPGGAGNTTYSYAFAAVALAEVVYGPPQEIVITQHPVSTNVNQNLPFTLSVQVTGTAPQFQWHKGTPGSGTPITGANGASYTVASAQLADAGSYYVVVQNTLGPVTSTAATVTVIADSTPPVLVSAVRQPNITNIVITYSEAMASNALDKFSYLVCTDESYTDCVTIEGNDPSDPQGFRMLWADGTGDDRTRILMATTMPLDINQSYILSVSGVSDLAGNTEFNIMTVPVTIPLIRVLQQGLNSYTGVKDTFIEQDAPTATHNTEATFIVDNDNPVSQGLIRFDDLFGNGVNQVPLGTTINSATLRLYTVDPGFNINVHRMLGPWNDTDSWDTLVGGVSTDGSEAIASPDATFDPHPDESFEDIDVTASVQAWAHGGVNYGWVLINSGSGSDGGYDVASSEHATQDWRPQLTIDFSGSCTPEPVQIVTVPASSTINVDQGSPFEIAFGVTGCSFPTFQWFFRPIGGGSFTPVTGAIDNRYGLAVAMPANGGDYYLQAQNDFPSSTNSPIIRVNVLIDTNPPVVVSADASGATSLTSVTVVFHEDVDPTTAVATGNYTITPAAAVTGATLVDARTVRLTISAPFGVRYALRVIGVRDIYNNAILTPGQSLEIATRLILSDWGDTWKYDANNTDLITAGYMNPTYDDSLWLSGPGLFGVEDGAGTLTFLADNTTNSTPNPSTAVAGNNWTTYFRKQLNWPFAPGALPADVELRVRSVVDDGLVVHLNGTELWRFQVAAAPAAITHATEADGHEATSIQTNLIPVSSMLQGNNVLAVDVHPDNATSSDLIFGAQIVLVLPPQTPVQIVTVPATNVIEVTAGDSFNIAFGVTGYLPRYQWFRNSAGIAGATNNTYSVTYARAADAGAYYLQVTNINPSSTNSPIIQVIVNPDTNIASLASAVRQTDPTVVRATFSEEVIPAQATNAANYAVCLGGTCVTVTGVTLSGGNTVATLTTATPVPENYTLTVINVTDRGGNLLNPNSQLIATPTIFQQGAGGYAGTVDTYINQDAADTVFGDGAVVLVDGDGPLSHGLLRFENIIGSGAGQVPFGSTVNNATLRLYVQNNGDPILLYRMIAAWNSTDTWNTYAGVGISNIIAATPETTFNSVPIDTFIDIDVTASVQAWATGVVNYGWGMINSLTDGFRFDSAEGTNGVARRPALIVDWTDTGVCFPVTIAAEPPATQTVVEGAPVNIMVAAAGTSPAYQWQKNGVNIPGATSATYTIPATVPTDSGTYRCVITNNCPSTITSQNSVLTVDPDTNAPVLLSAIARGTLAAPALTTVQLTFNEALRATPAGTAGNYTISLDGGGAVVVNSAVLTAGTNVTLTLASPLTFGVRATLNLSPSVSDNAATPNPVTPSSTNIVQQIAAIEWAGAWRFDQTKTDTDNYDGQAWYTAAFSDAGWSNGAALVGLETSAAVLGRAPVPISTPLTNINGTVYFRGSFNWNLGAVPAGSELIVNHFVDDGIACYVNGTETFRYNLTNMPLVFVDRAEDAIEAELQSTNLAATAVLNGANLVACELHAGGTGDSSDALFGMEVLVQFVGGIAPPRPELALGKASATSVTLSWSGTGGTLYEAPAVTGPWTPVAGATNPMTITTTGAVRKFYSLRQ